MSNEYSDKNVFANQPPGVCIFWETKKEELGDIKGDPEIIKSEWEQLDAMAYIYHWWWVQR